MEAVGRSDVYDDVVYDDRQRSKSASSVDSQQNGDRPHSNRSHRRHSRLSSRLSIAADDQESRLPTPAPSPKPDTTSRRDQSLVPLSTRETLSSVMSHRRQTVGGKLGFITFEDILGDVISLCPQMTSWLIDSLDNVVCVNYDLESSKERALPAFYYANTSLQGAGSAVAAVRGAKTSRPSTVATSVDPDNITKRNNYDGSCAATPRPTPNSGRRRTRKQSMLLPEDDDYRCFARSPSSLRVIYEPDF